MNDTQHEIQVARSFLRDIDIVVIFCEIMVPRVELGCKMSDVWYSMIGLLDPTRN